MSVTYEDALTRWDRSRAFGDPRDFQSFANDMESLQPGQGFGQAASRDGWWTRASTRADTGFFHPLADVTTAPVGAEIGSWFGPKGEEIGRNVGRAIPRMAAQTLPLVAAEFIPGAQPLATAGLVATTGALFGGQTYAETGSPTAAAISGITAAALPGAGAIGRKIGVEAASKFVPEWFANRAGGLAGSQAAQIGTLQASQYLQSRATGTPYDPLDPNFWATQIPFTALDIVHAATAKAEVPKTREPFVPKPVEKPYEPPTKASEDETVAATLDQMQTVLADETASPEMKEAVVAAALNVSLEPKVGTALKQRPTEDVTPITGYARKMINGNYKVLVPDDEGGDKTVFVNGVEPTTNPDGTVTFAAKPSQVKASVTSPLTRRDFGISRPGEAELPVQPKEWAGFPPDMQRTLEEHGAAVPPVEMPEDVRANLRAEAEKIQQAHEQIATTKSTIASVPQTAEEITPQVGPPEVAKPTIEQHVKSGATPTQAVEQARLAAQTPQLDEALRQLAVSKEKVQSVWKGKPQAKYGDFVRDESGKNFQTQSLAEAYKEADPDLEDYVVRNAGKDKGFYLAKPINKEVSLEGTQLDKVLEAPTSVPGEVEPQNRPEVSFQDAIASLDRAIEEPQVLARVLGLDPNEPLDVLQATKYAKQAREIYRQTEGGKPLDLVEVNKALKAQGSTPIADEGRAQRILQIVGAGIDEFNGRYRNWGLESAVPHDEALVQKIGVREGGLPAVLDWYTKRPDAGLVGTLVGDLKSALPDLSKVQVSYNQREGWRYFEHGPDVQRINIPYLPTEATADGWALNVTHEVAHYASKDLVRRTDPAAVRFKATLVEVLNALKNSKELPQKVRDVVALSSKNGWYRDFNATGDGKLFQERWLNAVGAEHNDWFQVFYGLQNPEEMLSQTFGSRKMVELMQNVRMPKTLKDTVLQYFSRAWNAVFGGGKPLTDSALERVLVGFDDYLSGPKIGPRSVVVDPNYGRWTFDNGPNYPDSMIVTISRPLPSDKEARPNHYDSGASIPAQTTEPYRVTIFSTTAKGELIPQDHIFATADTLKDEIVRRIKSYDPNVATKIDNKLGFQPTTVHQSVPYNARDFIRDSLVANGVRPEALASRVQSIEQTFADGNLGASIVGFERESQNGHLPATATTAPLNETVKTALQTGVPQDIYHGTMNLLAEDVPVHADLWWQMKQDVDVATQLYSNVKKGLVPGELPVDAKENLALAQVKLNAMRRALTKQAAALERFNQLSNFTLDGMENTFGQVLEGRSLPGPPDPTGLEPEAQDLLGLKRATTSRGELEKGMTQRAWDWVNRNLMLTQHAKQLIPGVRPVVDHVQAEQGDAFTRMTRLNFVRGYNPETGALDRKLIDTTRRVEQNASLSKAASDIRRWINVQNKEGKKWSLDDTFVKEVLGRSGDPKAVLTELQSEFRRWEDFNDQIVPQFLAKLNNRTTAYLIAARETGMKPDVARDLSEQMYSALGMLKQQETAPYGMETLRMLAEKMQPDTYLKALQMSKELIDSSEKHIAFRKSTPVYTSEQRFDKHHIVMMTPDGKPYRASFETRDAAQEKITSNEKAGYKFLDYIPKSDANVAGKLSDELIASMKELDLQTATKLAEALKDKPDLYAQVLPMTQRASDYDSSQAAFTSIPGGTVRKFVAGREGINMVTNSNLMYSRYNNWMRHKLVRAESDLDMLDPDLMSNRASMKYVRQHVENQLASDNQLTRQLVQGTYYWKLAWNFGVNVLHGIQSLTTGMTQMIVESGGVGDAFKLTAGAQKSMIQRMVTGKWDSAEHKWLADKLVSQGHAGIASWADIYGDQLVTLREASQSTNPLLKAGGLVQKAADSWTGMFLKFNDLVGSFGAFDLAKQRGMSNEEAYNFAVDVKNRAYYTGGKAQRAVGLWSIKTKPVPQLMSSLQIYTFGWFSQLASNWQRGFGRPPVELSYGERLGAKKAFLYQLGVQAVLAGAVGLPGVGQGMALIKQATGTDPKAWLRQHMGEMFGEDQDNGGLMTALALHGLVAAATPLDPSGRHIPTFPFTGVSPYKGFDVANLASAPVSAASDIVKGLLAAAKGDVQGAGTLLPHVLSGPFQLWQGEGDVRDKSGNLITKLSPAERFVTALGMTPSRVSTLKDTDAAAKQASTLAAAEKSSIISRMATIYRQQGPQAGQRELVTWLQAHPGEDARSLVRAIAGRVTAQTTPVDWRRNVNVAADLSGLTSRMPSTELQRVQGQSDIAASLGLPQRPSGRVMGMAARLDELMDSDPYLSRAEALQLLSRPRRASQLSPFVAPQAFQ